MRAGIVDARPVPAGVELAPPAQFWTLAGGAVIDGGNIALPAVGSSASSRPFRVDGASILNFNIPAFVPSGSGQVYMSTNYLGNDQVTAALNTQGNAGNGTVPVYPVGTWGTVNRGFVIGPSVVWVRFIVQITAVYGVPGTKFTPQGITVTR